MMLTGMLMNMATVMMMVGDDEMVMKTSVGTTRSARRLRGRRMMMIRRESILRVLMKVVMVPMALILRNMT